MAETILYVDMWVGERIQEMKLAGIRRYAAMLGWNVKVLSEVESRPALLAKALSDMRPVGCIVEGSGAHTDLPPRIFGKTPIGAMASFCGFKSDIALSKLFHRRFGMSLLAWRKANRAV